MFCALYPYEIMLLYPTSLRTASKIRNAWMFNLLTISIYVYKYVHMILQPIKIFKYSFNTNLHLSWQGWEIWSYLTNYSALDEIMEVNMFCSETKHYCLKSTFEKYCLRIIVTYKNFFNSNTNMNGYVHYIEYSCFISKIKMFHSLF